MLWNIGHLRETWLKIQEIVGHDKFYIAGGALTSTVIGVPVNDYDVFFVDDGGMAKALAAFKEKFGDKCYETENALTYQKYQLIKVVRGAPDMVVSTFDFAHAQIWYGYNVYDRIAFLDDVVKDSLMSRQLVYRGSRYPLASLLRVKKFMKRGWDIRATELIKIAIDIQNKVDFTTIDSLKEHFRGIDILYLAEVTEKIERELGSGPFAIDDVMRVLDYY